MGDYKLVLIGSGGVGKSALTIQFVQRIFVDEYDPTIEDSYRKQITVDGKDCLLDILDTAGQEDFAALRDAHIKQGDGFICAYSITDPQSFSEVGSFREQIVRCKDTENVPLILAGTKCDLVDSRQISYEEGRELAASFGCPMFETSAKTVVNIDEPFFQLVREIRKYNQRNKKTPRGSSGCTLL